MQKEVFLLNAFFSKMLEKGHAQKKLCKNILQKYTLHSLSE